MTIHFQNCTKKTGGENMNKWMVIAVTTGLVLNVSPIWAADQVGTLTQIEGIVKVFSHPSKTLKKEAGATYALYEGEYFKVEEAKIGSQVDKGNIVQTAPGAKARVVYGNGDQFNVGSGTAYKVSWDKDSKDGKTEMNLAYGKLRGIIEKGGPRSRLQIKTRSAVMGVRGTDFFIAQGGSDDSTEISIMRGSVEVTPKFAEKTKDQKTKTPAPAPVKITAGHSAAIDFTPDTTAKAGAVSVNPKVELRKTTQEELAGIQKSSTIAKSTTQPASTPEVQKSIEKLEKQATVTILNDIKTHDKKLFATLEKQTGKEVSIDALNQAAMQQMIQEAPKAPAQRKPYKSELENIENGAYEKYFKNVD